MHEGAGRKDTALRWLGVAGAILGVALIIFGVGTLVKYQGEHTDEREHATAYQTESTQGEIQATCAQQQRSRTYRCTANIPVADNHDAYAEHDLKAQQDMARWAYAVMLISLGTLLLTGVGVLLLWWTLEATREAVRAAVSANSGFAEASHREMRAYLSVRGAEAQLVFSPNRNVVVDLIVKNVGRTPAHKVTVGSGMCLRDPDWSAPEYDTLNLNDPRAVRVSLMPEDEIKVRVDSSETGNPWIPGPEHIEAVQQGLKCVFVFGQATYHDAITGSQWYTRFCFQVDAGAINVGSLKTSRFGNVAT